MSSAQAKRATTAAISTFPKRGGVVSITTRLRTGLSGLRIPVREGDFSFPKRPYRLWGLSFNGYLSRG
jgi:hypothetical protein